ncbi:MAG: sigma-70 family RNA polymerase sigma factor [Bacilli bacterium]|nr:MAG: sigma-70 family RNA polymerase sigma factor [Bacilli bacterium]
MNKQKNIKVSKEYLSLYKKINAAKNIFLSQKLMKEPTTYELATFLEIEPNIIETVINSMQVVDSLERVIYAGDNNLSLYDTVSDNKDYYNIDYLLLNEEVNKLESPYKELIYLRYFEDRTQASVAECLGMNQVEVSRNEKKALKKIRNNYQVAA